MKRIDIIIGLSIILAIWSCSEIIVAESDSNLNVEDIEVAWSYINDIYPLFEFKNIDWNSIHDEYRERAVLSKGDEIYGILVDLVGELKDGHAKILTLGGLEFRPYTPPRSLKDEDVFNPNISRKYFDRPLKVIANDIMEYEFVSNNIGYVRIASFGNVLGNRVNSIDVVIDYFSDANGIIMDIRNNGGGGSAVYDQVIGRLIDSPLETESAVSRMGTRPPYSIMPRGPRQYTGPIVILINGKSFSGAEVFAERMRQLDYITLLGDTTAGGGVSSNSDPRFFLPSGKSISINYESILRLDGEPLEWNGVPPDILVTQTIFDAEEGRDRQLEAAIDILTE